MLGLKQEIKARAKMRQIFFPLWSFSVVKNKLLRKNKFVPFWGE